MNVKSETALIFWPLVGAAALLVLGGCSSEAPTVARDSVTRHTLVYGGDFFVARRLNYSLHDPSERNKILEGIAPVLRDADIAMLNSEGVVTVGGHFYNLSAATYMFRAHPNLVDHLGDSGIDIVILGNNHVPDYGPEALVEYTDRLRKAGIGYAGAGVDRNDARRTIYRKVGDTVVAIVSAELCYAQKYAATSDKAGGHYVRAAFKQDAWDRTILGHFKKVAARARRHAHVVLFSPHWDAWGDRPHVSEKMRKLGRGLIDAGFDGILAHGSHATLGVEVHDGMPIIYDAGNSVLDYDAGNENARGMLWQIEFTRAGIHAIEGIPIYLRRNRTEIADGRPRALTLKRAVELSEPHGTKLEIVNGRVRLELDPGEVRGPSDAVEPPRREPVEKIRLASNDVLHKRLPTSATKIDVQWENGIQLVGYELLAPKLRPGRSSQQVVVLYWKTSKAISDSHIVHLEARQLRDGKTRSPRGAHHLPGDWMFPTPLWPVGKVVQDATVVRLGYEPVGKVAFYAGLRRLGTWTNRVGRGRVLPPTRSSVDLDGRLVPLGATPYGESSESMRETYYQWRRTRDIELLAEQPWGAPAVKRGQQY